MQAKTRICLKCNKPFDSYGPANRICPHCQRVNTRLAKVTEAEMKKQRGEKWRNGELIE